MMGVIIGNHPRGRVATYRAYRIDDTGRIAEMATVFEAPDDVTAITRSRALMGNRDQFEIWEGSRRIGLATLVPENIDAGPATPIAPSKVPSRTLRPAPRVASQPLPRKVLPG
jgi:hypothetical protein